MNNEYLKIDDPTKQPLSLSLSLSLSRVDNILYLLNFNNNMAAVLLFFMHYMQYNNIMMSLRKKYLYTHSNNIVL